MLNNKGMENYKTLNNKGTKMDKKIIFLDLDGTLTNDEKKITPKTKEALMDIQKRGHIVALASGRPTPGMGFIAKELELEKYGGYVMSFNGGKIINWKTKETVFENTLDRKYLPDLIRYARQNNLGLITYDNKQGLVATRVDPYVMLETVKINRIPAFLTDVVKYVDYNPNKCLYTVDPEFSEYHEKRLAEKFGDVLSVYRSTDYFIEIVPKGIDKAASIKVLIDKLNIPHENTIACGDGFNDLSMIKYAAVGVAMENAVDAVKESADYITASNNDDGIAKVVEKFITD